MTCYSGRNVRWAASLALAYLPFSMASAATMPALPAASASLAKSPTQVVDDLDATLLSVMKDAKKLGLEGRYQKLEAPITRTFNIPFMTRIVVGPVAWGQWSEEQRKTVIAAFSKFIVSTYAHRFDGYSGESFIVDGAKQLSNGTVVTSRLLRPHDDAVILSYVTRQNPDQSWQAVDVFLTGSISELATRRSEFSAVLQQQGYPGLLKALDEKSKLDVATTPR